MALTAGWIMDRVARALHDEQHVRWPEAELLLFLNMAQLQVAMARPEATGAFSTMKLAPSAQQTLPADFLQLFTITRNMGQTGLVAGRHVAMTDRPTMDAQLSTWGVGGSAPEEIESYVFDDRVATQFFVYPVPDVSKDVWIEFSASRRPVDCATVSSTIAMPDIYLGPLMHWMMYQALIFQVDSPISSSQAVSHYQLFNLELGIQMSAADLVNPVVNETYVNVTRTTASTKK